MVSRSRRLAADSDWLDPPHALLLLL